MMRKLVPLVGAALLAATAAFAQTIQPGGSGGGPPLPVSVANGGTGGTTQATGRAGLGAAASGANSDITSLSGLTTPLSVGQGGTGGTTQATARNGIGAAASGANSDITSLSGLTTALSQGQGGTGSNALGAATLVSSGSSTARSLGSRFTQILDVRDYGAVCDGSTPDQAAFTSAISALTAQGGGVLLVPATGHGCVIASGISLGNGVVISGVGSAGFPGMTATVAQWTAAGGSWLICQDTTNPCVTLNGHGTGVYGLNFIYNQVVAPTYPATYTPTTFGYAIKVPCDFCYVRNVNIVGASHGISLTYTSSAGGGTHVDIEDVLDGALTVCLTANYVNDTVNIRNFHCRNVWYEGSYNNDSVTVYEMANKIGMDIHYLDNASINDYECLYCFRAMQFTNDTILGNTHSFYNGFISNMQCNLVAVCMYTTASTTTATFHASGVIAQSVSGVNGTLFNLASDGVNAQIEGLSIPYATDQLINIGGGTSGTLTVRGLRVDAYSQSTGASGIVVNNGAITQFNSIQNYTKSGSAGVRFAGAGSGNTSTDAFSAVNVLSTFGQETGSTNGSWQDVSVDYYQRPGNSHVYQIRIIGQIQVTTAVASSSLSFQLANIPEITVTGISSASTGWVSFDSGWIDVTQTNLNNLTNWGRVQIKGSTSGIGWSSGPLQVLTR
jgi:hypothetical protein